MRKSIFAAFCLLLSVCAGCGPQAKTETEPDDAARSSKTAREQTAETADQKPSREPPIYVEPKTYEEVLNAIYDFASADPKDRRPAICVNMNRTGLKEIMHGDTPKKRLSRIGYCIEDVSGDGIPELMIGEIDNKSENKSTRIISLYTTVDGEARLARGYRLSINGWYRNRYYLLDNGLLYNEGSGGAANISRSVYRLSEDGASVKKLETLSTFPLKVETIRSGSEQRSVAEIGSHHRVYDENGNCTLEELDEPETKRQRRRMWEEYKSRAVEIDLMPMSEYKPSHGS